MYFLLCAHGLGCFHGNDITPPPLILLCVNGQTLLRASELVFSGLFGMRQTVKGVQVSVRACVMCGEVILLVRCPGPKLAVDQRRHEWVGKP